MIACAYNPSTGRVEVGNDKDFEARFNYIVRLFLKKTKYFF